MTKAFKLEKILDFRLKILDREKAALAEAKSREQALLVRLNEIYGEIELKKSELDGETARGRFDFADLYAKYISKLENDRILVENKKREIEAEIEKKRMVLREALNGVKIMEKLKEKHALQYSAYLKKLEERQVDEINITKSR